jgi:hypothetical protein
VGAVETLVAIALMGMSMFQNRLMAPKHVIGIILIAMQQNIPRLDRGQ